MRLLRHFPVPLFFLLSFGLSACGTEEPKPVMAQASTATATVMPTLTHPPATLTPSPTATNTLTPSVLPSLTATPSLTPTLAEPVLAVNAVMGDAQGLHNPPATVTPLALSAIPSPSGVIPDATAVAAPYLEWYAFESDHPSIEYQGQWVANLANRANRGQYHYSVDRQAHAAFTFTGEAVRVRYVGFTNAGIWELWIDGALVATIDGYAPEAAFTTTPIYPLSYGQHHLEIRVTERKNPQSSAIMVALDTIEVYQAPLQDNPLSLSPPSPTTTPQPASGLDVIQSAPTLQATATEPPPAILQVSVVVAYDENANRTVDLAEGVQAISIRLVEVGTNRILAQGFTDSAGFARLEAITNSPVRLVVPYFGAYWDIRPTLDPQSFTLLMPPGNQPGLIP